MIESNSQVVFFFPVLPLLLILSNKSGYLLPFLSVPVLLPADTFLTSLASINIFYRLFFPLSL